MSVEPTKQEKTSPACVLFINLWPESGMKHYSESLVHALAPCGRVLYVLNYESCVAVENLRVDLHPTRPGGWWDLWRIARTVIKRRPRVIHLNSELPILLPLFPLFAFYNSVITLHDAVPHDGERTVKRLFMKAHLVLVFLFIGKVIVHSATIRAELPEWLRSRAHVLPHVNYRLWGKGAPAEPAGGPFRVLFFGRLLPYKGLEYLLEAFERLDPAKFELVIAGDGDLAGYALEAPNIKVINRFIPDEEMPELFRNSHAVALPYVSASQSGVAYMAFAFGRPVVATRVGALTETVADGSTGYLVEPRDAAALAEALQKLAEPATWQRMSEAVCRQNLSADEDIRKRLQDVYQA